MKKNILVCLLFVGALAHAEPAHTVRATDVHADSQSDAATLAKLPENAALDVVQRRGAWSQVKASGQTGWVRMLDLRFDSKGGAASTSSNPASGLNGLLAAGRTSNSGTETTGAKGLTDEDLSNAQANPVEFQKMQKYASTKDAAQAFGKKSKLVVVSMQYLPAPPPDPSAPSAQDAQGSQSTQGPRSKRDN